MAIIAQGILGPFSGKVGTVVGCICTTRSFYIRSLPKHYRDARTPEQLRNREKLKRLMAFLSSAKGFVNHHLSYRAVGQTATNVATALNFHRAFDESGGLVYGDVLLSSGSVEGLEGLTVVRTGSGMEMSWNRLVVGVNGSGRDKVSVMVYNALRGESMVAIDEARRMDGGLRVRIPDAWAGEELHVYLGVVDENGLRSSDSCHMHMAGEGEGRSAVSREGMRSGEKGEESQERSSVISFFDLEQSATKVVEESGQRGGKEPPN